MEGYSRNVSCTLNLISTVFFNYTIVNISENIEFKINLPICHKKMNLNIN